MIARRSFVPVLVLLVFSPALASPDYARIPVLFVHGSAFLCEPDHDYLPRQPPVMQLVASLLSQ